MPTKRDADRPTLGRPPLHAEPHRSVTLSLPTALHEALRAESRRTGTPMSRIVADAVRKALGGGQGE